MVVGYGEATKYLRSSDVSEVAVCLLSDIIDLRAPSDVFTVLGHDDAGLSTLESVKLNQASF